MLKLERLSEVKEEQPENICGIYVTLLVLKFAKEIEVKFVRRFASVELLNKRLESTGAKIVTGL